MGLYTHPPPSPPTMRRSSANAPRRAGAPQRKLAMSAPVRGECYPFQLRPRQRSQRATHQGRARSSMTYRSTWDCTPGGRQRGDSPSSPQRWPLIGERAATRGRSVRKVAMSARCGEVHPSSSSFVVVGDAALPAGPGERFASAHSAFVAAHDAPLIGERAATHGGVRWNATMSCPVPPPFLTVQPAANDATTLTLVDDLPAGVGTHAGRQHMSTAAPPRLPALAHRSIRVSRRGYSARARSVSSNRVTSAMRRPCSRANCSVP